MWTDDRVDQLKMLWTEGLSCSQIARVLNAGGGDAVTRNAVIGKITRLGLANRTLRPRRPAGNGLPRRSYAPRQSPPKPVVLLAPALDADGHNFTALTIAYLGQCKWPYDSPDVDGGCIFCAHPSGDDVWCEAHRAVAYDFVGTARANGRASSRQRDQRRAA